MPTRLQRMFPAPLAIIALAAFAALFSGPVGPAEAGGGACHVAPSGQDRDGGGATVVMRMNCFVPTVLRVEPGTTVSFTNNDMYAHEIAGVGMEWGSADGMPQGAVAKAVFEKPGIYPYACRLHFGMVGAVVVGDGKFVGVLGGVSNGRSGVVEDTKASLAHPAPASPAVAAAAAAPTSTGRSPWLYAGGGLIAGVLLVGALSAGIATKRG